MSTKGNKGFINHGATCYLNSALQCLSHIDILSDNNFKNQIIKYKRGNTPLVDEWLNIQNQMWSDDNNNSINSSNLIQIFIKKCKDENIYFESFQQNDASEFLTIFLDGIPLLPPLANINDIVFINPYKYFAKLSSKQHIPSYVP